MTGEKEVPLCSKCARGYVAKEGYDVKIVPNDECVFMFMSTKNMMLRDKIEPRWH